MSKITHVFIVVLIILLSVWVSLFIWTHQPISSIFSYLLIIAWNILTILLLVSRKKPNLLPTHLSTKKLGLFFIASFIIAVVVFFTIQPSNQHQWNPEDAQLLDYSLAADGKTLTLYHVRNFNWIEPKVFEPRWETRHYDLEKLQTLDVVASHWMSDAIAHIFVSFGFSDGQHVALSIEIRKEKDEDFSNIAGFFRQYELIIIAADEKDIIYRRTNVNNENVYIYPIHYDKADIRQLFMAYLDEAKDLTKHPRWYNSLLNNCTTGIYQLVRPITPAPFDYRILLTGYVPNYLYDHNAISHQYSFEEWRRRAYINPKIAGYSAKHPISSQAYSALIRRDF